MTDEQRADLRASIVELDEAARRQVDLAVNAAMVHAYWRIGRALADVSSPEVLRELADELSWRLCKAVTVARLEQMKLFHREYPKGSALCPAGDAFPPELSFSQYLLLLAVDDREARDRLEATAVAERWSVRELELQVLTRTHVPSDDRRRDRMLPGDLMKDLHALEFLEPAEPNWSWSRTRRHALIDRLSSFLLGCGKSLCLVQRNERAGTRVDSAIALVMYHRVLHCVVLVDLQLAGAGIDVEPMRSFLAVADRKMRRPDDTPSIGIVIWCGLHDLDAELVFPDGHPGDANHLPTEDELMRALFHGRDRVTARSEDE